MSKDKRPPPIRNEKGLLSESEFASLAEMSFFDKNETQDIVARERIWQKICKDIPEEHTMSLPSTRQRKFWLSGAFTAIAAALLIGVFSLLQSDDDPLRVKGDATLIADPLQLSVYLVDASGELTNIDPKQVAPGDSLVFSARSTQPTYVSLVHFDASENVHQINEPHKLEAGKEWIIGDHDSAYSYVVEDELEGIRFCLLGDTMRSAFTNLSVNLLKGAHRFRTMDCITFTSPPSW